MEQTNMVEEISLRELIEILLKRKKMIAIITAIAIMSAGIASFFIITPIYESSMILMASNTSDKISATNLDGNIDQMLDTISKYPAVNIETYRQQVKTPEVLSRTIKDLGLEEKYSVESLGNSITLETIKDTQLITIKMKNEDPEKAAEIVNRIGENFIAFVSENAKNKATTTSNYLAAQMEKEKQKYDEVLLEQKEILSQPRSATEVQLELNALLSQITGYKTELNNLSIESEAIQASLEVAKNQPSKSSSLIIDQNNGRVILDSSEKTLQMDLAEVDTRYKVIKEKISSLQSEIENLQIEYQEKSHKESLINQKVSLAKSTYESFVRKYEEIRVVESAEIGNASITVISKAHPSSRPVAPRKALNVAIAGVVGIMVGVFAAFFIEYWQATDIKKEPNIENI